MSAIPSKLHGIPGKDIYDADAFSFGGRDEGHVFVQIAPRLPQYRFNEIGG
jgi:hypothetical protein